jgi:hypothetical protein
MLWLVSEGSAFARTWSDSPREHDCNKVWLMMTWLTGEPIPPIKACYNLMVPGRNGACFTRIVNEQHLSLGAPIVEAPKLSRDSPLLLEQHAVIKLDINDQQYRFLNYSSSDCIRSSLFAVEFSVLIISTHLSLPPATLGILDIRASTKHTRKSQRCRSIIKSPS